MPDSIIKADNISSLSGGGVGFPNGSISNPSMKFTNSSTTGLYRPSANQLGLVTNGVERLRIDNNGQVSSVIPNGNTLYNGFMCRAWVNFNGVDGSIRASGNVSSITKNGAGDYTINFIASMPDVNFAVTGSADLSNAKDPNGPFFTYRDTASQLTTTSARIMTSFFSGGFSDCRSVYVMVFR